MAVAAHITRSPQRANIRAMRETAVDRAIAALDAFDGDPDFEDQCEDEGGACEDEGGQCDDEGAVEWEGSLEYAAGGTDQTRFANVSSPVQPNLTWGAR